MAIFLLDGFDQVPGATDIAATLESMGYTISGDGALAWAPGRLDGSQALVLSQDVETVALERSVAWDGDIMVLGFSVNVTERAQLVDVNGVLQVGWDDDGLHLRDQVSTAKPIRDRWYYIELELDKVNTECRVYINDTLDMTAPLPSELTTATQLDIKLAGVNPTNVAGQPAPDDGTIIPADILIDDLYLANEVLGALAVTTRFPDADVVTEWTTPEGVTPQYPEVTQQPPTDDRYITSYENGAIDLFSSSKTLPDAEIKAVALTVRARKGDIDARAVGLLLGQGADQVEEEQSELTLESAYYTKYFEPASGEMWDAATLETMPFGVAVR